MTNPLTPVHGRLSVHIPGFPAHALHEHVQSIVAEIPGMTGAVVWGPAGEAYRWTTTDAETTRPVYLDVDLDGPLMDVNRVLALVKVWLAERIDEQITAHVQEIPA